MFLDDVYPRIREKFGIQLVGKMNGFITYEPGKNPADDLGDLLVPVNIQNVVDYYVEHVRELVRKDGTVDVGEEFPNVKPPWPLSWYEWKYKGMDVGVLLIQSKLDEQKPINKILNEYEKFATKQLSEAGMKLQSESRTIYNDITPVSETVQYQCYIRTSNMRKNESLTPQNGMYGYDPTGEMKSGWHITIDTIKDYGDMAFLAPVWLALTFLHCKNTEVIEAKDISEKLQKARMEKGKLPLFKVKTLNVTPTRRIIDNTRVSQNVSALKALHICRGHFKDYSEGRGLFGKYKGLYWWDMHSRGNSENGVLVKDYNIKI